MLRDHSELADQKCTTVIWIPEVHSVRGMKGYVLTRPASHQTEE
jgi:hypothetical protein